MFVIDMLDIPRAGKIYGSRDVINKSFGRDSFLNKNKLVSLKLGFERGEELQLSMDFEK